MDKLSPAFDSEQVDPLCHALQKFERRAAAPVADTEPEPGDSVLVAVLNACERVNTAF